MIRTLAVALAVLLVSSSPCLAWDSSTEIVHGSARVLEKGETIVGIFSPLGYGVLERLTVFTHPALLLLLTPSLWARVAVLSGPSALSVELGYEQSLLQADGARPGYLQGGLVFSQALGRSAQLTAAVGYLAEFGRDDVPADWAGLYYRVGADFIIGRSNLIILNVRGAYMSNDGFRIPTGTLIYAREMGRMRLGIGASLGKFMISKDFSESGSDADDTALYVYPWLDLWWRF